LIDGNQATGGGATRSQGRADVGNRQISRNEFDSLGQGARAQFIKEGGRVYDD